MTQSEERIEETDVAMLIDEDLSNRLFRVHRRAFTSQEIFDREMETMWSKNWLFLGHDSEIPNPGDFATRVIGGRSVIFCRDQDGEVRIFLNACPHRGTMLCRAPRGNTKRFECFYHAWVFNTDGRLVAVPHEDAYPSDIDFKSRYGLRPAPRVEAYRGFVFVSFNPDVEDLVTHLAGATYEFDCMIDQSPQGLEVIRGAHLFSSRVNWKMAVENAHDVYHLIPTHATWLDNQRHTGFKMDASGGWRKLGNGHFETWGAGFSPRAGLTWDPKWGAAEKERIASNVANLRARVGEERAREITERDRNSYIFPNLLTFDFLGLALRVIEPVAPGMTNFYAFQLAPIGEPKETRALRLTSVISFIGPGGLASPDDIEALMLAQIGFTTTASDPRDDVPWSDISRGFERELRNEKDDYNDEGSVRAFWRFWRDRMVEHPTNGRGG